jgi:hypothetical protein
MKKRKAKRIKPSNNVDIEFEIAKTMDEHEKMKEKALIDLIVKIVVKATLDEYYDDDKPPELFLNY